MPKIYLDYAATTPVDPGVFSAMKPYFTDKFGNPGSLHSFGQAAIAAIDHSREVISNAIGADFREIIFTGSATEANNLAFKMIDYQSLLKKNMQPKIIVSAIEHESILEVAREFEKQGIEVVYVPVNKNGTIDIAALKKQLDERTMMVSVMYANNEIGAIQPIKEIADVIAGFRKEKPYPLFHTDASQAFQFLDCNVRELGVDLMTFSAHKIYGPKGVGALYIGPKFSKIPNKKTLPSQPVILGGGQEFGFRSGTENVPAIVGFAKAVELAVLAREKEAKRIGALRDEFWKKLKKIYPKAEINSDTKTGIPHIINIYFPGESAQDLLTKCDIAGLAVSSGSACRSRAMESSYVIEALGHSQQRAKSSIRFSFGRPTKTTEITAALKLFADIFRR